MPKYRNNLPQLGGGLFLTDSGLETTLIFKDGIELNQFASFELLKTERGRDRLARIFPPARADRRRCAAWASCWRARPGAATPTGAPSSAIRREQLDALNRQSIELLGRCATKWRRRIRRWRSAATSARCGDGYVAGKMSADDAERLHAPQVADLRRDARPTW